MSDPAFQRLHFLVGGSVLQRIHASRVILFGVGGVGGWCAEALIRSGIRHLTIVDDDTICITNLNRQIQATKGNVGFSKVEELRNRLLSIHPGIEVEAIGIAYGKANQAHFELGAYDYVIDAIDSYTEKMELIEHARNAGTTLFSSMGAAGRLDITRIRTASLWDVRMDRFAKILRKGLRRRGFDGDLRCVYSEEPAILPFDPSFPESMLEQDKLIEAPEARNRDKRKHVINGSAVHVTAAFGMALAGLVIQDIRSFCSKEAHPDPVDEADHPFDR